MPYSKIDPDAMILRDHLAFDRTVLANERTLLSYLRTAIALLAAGATLVKIFPEEPSMVKVGTVLLAVGGAVAVTGVWRFFTVRKKLATTYKKLDD
jgi:putative membrane protein